MPISGASCEQRDPAWRCRAEVDAGAPHGFGGIGIELKTLEA
jgi:hypothetical protein